MVGTRLGSPRHVGDLEVLVDDEVVIVHQPTGQLVGEVPASAGDLAVVGGHPLLGLFPVLGTGDLGGQVPLGLLQARVAAFAERGPWINSPSLVATRKSTPRSIPMLFPVAGRGSAGTSTHCTLTQ